jgi:hypothetical protein
MRLTFTAPTGVETPVLDDKHAPYHVATTHLCGCGEFYVSGSGLKRDGLRFIADAVCCDCGQIRGTLILEL